MDLPTSKNVLPFTPETRHEVASVSKMFTSAAAIRLRDAGKLKLDDPICKYLDDCPEIWQPITVKQLMNHTSGIPDYEEKLDLGSERYLAFMTQRDATRQIVENAKKLPLDLSRARNLTTAIRAIFCSAISFKKRPGGHLPST